MRQLSITKAKKVRQTIGKRSASAYDETGEQAAPKKFDFSGAQKKDGSAN
ncbi:hypothetical protein [Marinobacter apostichopi]|nr:hypothetical protein [Marinobacter sp. LA51]